MARHGTIALFVLAGLLGGFVSAEDSGAAGDAPSKILDRPSTDPNAPKRPWQVWVAHEGLRPKEDPRPDSADVSFSQPFHFMDSYFVAARYPTKVPEYLFLVESADRKKVSRRVGWVPIGSTCGRFALKGAVKTDFRKAMIVNTITSLRNDGRGGRDVAWAEVYRGPNKTAPRAATVNLDARSGSFKGLHPFNTFYVYAESNDFLLMGSHYRFLPGPETSLSPRRVIRGWVRKNQTIPWGTRVAISWNTRTLVKPEFYELWSVYQELKRTRRPFRDTDVFEEYARRWPTVSKKRSVKDLGRLRRAFEDLALLLEVYSEQTDLRRDVSNQQILAAYEKRLGHRDLKSPAAKSADVELLRQVTNRPLGRVFTTVEAAHQYQKGELHDDPKRMSQVTLQVETADIPSFREFRSPLLAWQDERDNRLRGRSNRGNRLLRVGWLNRTDPRRSLDGECELKDGPDGQLRINNVGTERSGAAHVCREGYVWSVSRDEAREPRQVRAWILLTERQLRSLVDLLDKVTNNFTTGKMLDELVGDFAALNASLISGDVAEERHTSLAEAIKLVYGVNPKSRLLQMSSEELRQGLIPREIVERELHSLQLVSLRLRDILENRWRNYQQRIVSTGDGSNVKQWVHVAEVSGRDRSFSMPRSDAKWYWLDLETELP